MKKLFSFILFLVFSSVAFATQDNHSFKVSRERATNELRLFLIRELQQSVGLKEFFVTVELTVDKEDLDKRIKVFDAGESLSDVDLPGFYYSAGPDKMQLSDYTDEMIFQHLKEVKIGLTYHQTNYSADFLNSKIKQVVKVKFPEMTEDSINVETKLEEAPYKTELKDNLEDILNRFLSSPLKVMLAEKDFSRFWNANYKYIFAFVAIFIGLSVAVLTFSLSGKIGSIADVIKSKTFGGQGLLQTPPAQTLELKQASQGINHEETFESYVSALEHLRLMTQQEQKLFNEVLVLKLITEDFPTLLVILDVLQKERKDNFLGNMDKGKKERFKNYLVGSGQKALRDETFLKEQAVRTIKLIKVAALFPADLYYMVAVDLICSLGTNELSELITSSSSAEKAFVVELVGPNELAYLIQKDSLSVADIKSPSKVLSKEDIVELLVKAANILGKHRVQLRSEKLELIYSQLEAEKAETFAETVDLDPSIRFEFLFSAHKESALQYLQGLNFERIASIYPLLPSIIQEDLLNELPELLGERLKFTRRDISAESLKLKGEFYFYLRSLADKNASEISKSNATNLRLAS
jgi:hypothetical protein